MTTTRILSILTLLLAAPLMAQAQSAVELLERGREAYLDYRFSDASKDYAAAFRKFKKSDEENLDKYRLYNSQLTNARNFLERVEKIVIIDSISVPYPVEKKLTKWEQAKVDYGGYALVAVIILLTLAIWLARRYCSNR